MHAKYLRDRELQTLSEYLLTSSKDYYPSYDSFKIIKSTDSAAVE